MTYMFKLARRTARFRVVTTMVLLTVGSACDSADRLAPTDDAPPVVPSFSTTASTVSISNLSVSSGKTYRVVSGLAAGAKIYTDRVYTFMAPIPSAVAGATYIQTANDDKDAYPGSTSFLRFDVSADAVVYVAHDNRLSRPAWLTSGFQDTGLDLLSADSLTRYSLFKRSFPRGRVTLGSNVTTAAGRSMYIVLVLPAIVATPTSSVTGTGIPFGEFGLPTENYTQPYTGGMQHLSPTSSALTELSAARAAGIRLVISLAGSRSTFKNADGTFSMSKWKYNVSLWKSIAIGPYIADGTIVGHYLIDEPNWAPTWGGKVITSSEIEEMARYSKSIWPTMATGARVRPGALTNIVYTYLDFAWAQWEGPHGSSYNKTPEQYRDIQIADAKARGLNLIFGMNVLDGGDGSSGIWGTYDLSTVKTRWQMSAAEVSRVGKVLAAASHACAMIDWRWSPTYPAYSHLTASQLDGIRKFHTRSDVKSALAAVGSVAKNRTRKSCL